jgi:hypothetical protein
MLLGDIPDTGGVITDKSLGVEFEAENGESILEADRKLCTRAL